MLIIVGSVTTGGEMMHLRDRGSACLPRHDRSIHLAV